MLLSFVCLIVAACWNRPLTRLRYERTKRGLTQTVLGLATSPPLDQATISKIENERLNPTPDERQQLAELLDVPPSELLNHVVVAGGEQ